MRISSRWLVTGATLLLVLIALGLTAAVSQSRYWERWQQNTDELEPMQAGDAVETLSARLTADLERQTRELEAERSRLLRLLEEGDRSVAEQRRIEAEVDAIEREQVAIEEEIEEARTITSETFEVPVVNAAGSPASTEVADPTPAQPQPEPNTPDAEARVAELQSLQVELQQAASRIDALERESRRLSTALTNAERLVQETRDRMAEREESNESLQARLEMEASRRRELEAQIDLVTEEMGRTQARAGALFASSSILAVFYRADGQVRIAVHPDHRDRVLRQATFNVYPAGSDRSAVKSRVNVREENGTVTFAAFPGYSNPEAGDWF